MDKVNRLMPDPDLAPPVPEGLTAEQKSPWVDVMKACDAFLFAGLRREVGRDGERVCGLPSLVRGADGGHRSDDAADGGKHGPAPGKIMTTEVVLTTLKHVWTHLEPLHLPMAVMGGLTLSMWRYPPATRDVDLLVNVEASNVDAGPESAARGRLATEASPARIPLGLLPPHPAALEPPGRSWRPKWICSSRTRDIRNRA